MTSFAKILIANRGEIAARIIHTCHRLGIKTVAIYSQHDRHLPYVNQSDEAYLLEGESSLQTYLSIDQIIRIGRQSGADAIHPGYGFLSENADFAQAVIDAGMTFIGPSPQSIEWMGNKLVAKRMAAEAEVPLIPGDTQPIQSVAEGLAQAENIGFPVLIKAAAGGGGKGMRIVHDAASFEQSFTLVRSEAFHAFGNNEVFIEKYIVEPKHIEVQIFGDQQGNMVHLFERDCSVQRRHQKLIEEAPASTLSESVKQELYQSAIRLGQRCSYFSSGTIEYLVDRDENIYFLEMNTRLQVEHPVTEMITQVDLVEWQIKIAEGQPLPLTQEEIQRKGHAIELRIYAEDYRNDFAPSPGPIQAFHFPEASFLRLDSGMRAGNEVTLFYDPLIAKLIVWGEDRRMALSRLDNILRESYIVGIDTSIPFALFALKQNDFLSGQYHIGFCNQFDLTQILSVEEEMSQIAAVFCQALLKQQQRQNFIEIEG